MMTVLTSGIHGRGVAPRAGRQPDARAWRDERIVAAVAGFVAAVACAVLIALIAWIAPGLVAAARDAGVTVLGDLRRLEGLLAAPLILLPPTALIAGPSVLARIRERRAGR